ncbi:DUF3991 and TOPRIM domain-containing protein [Rhodopirellula bahusiensis]|nr:DUF3991 and TOPRIM domain-containing protein [Rhodopirellula bahusiensis]
MDRETELDRFKRDIALPVFCAGEFGYRVVPKKTSPNSCFMKNPLTGSKIAIQRNAKSLHWTYWSATDPGDRGGSIVDLVQHRTTDNLGQVRKRLRPWVGACPSSSLPIADDVPHDVTPTQPDVLEVRMAFQNAVRPLAAGQHRYLNNARHLTPELLSAPPFTGSVHSDKRGNAVFAHRDQTGVTGWESRNDKWKSFSSSGYKSLWFASPPANKRLCLVFAESAIDAISYGCLHPRADACYLSTGGQLSELQRELASSAMTKLPSGGEIIIAADNDAGGETFTKNFRDVLQQIGRDDLHFKEHAPRCDGVVKDWNDVLKQTPCNLLLHQSQSRGLDLN